MEGGGNSLARNIADEENDFGFADGEKVVEVATDFAGGFEECAEVEVVECSVWGEFFGDETHLDFVGDTEFARHAFAGGGGGGEFLHLVDEVIAHGGERAGEVSYFIFAIGGREGCLQVAICEGASCAVEGFDRDSDGTGDPSEGDEEEEETTDGDAALLDGERGEAVAHIILGKDGGKNPVRGVERHIGDPGFFIGDEADVFFDTGGARNHP